MYKIVWFIMGYLMLLGCCPSNEFTRDKAEKACFELSKKAPASGYTFRYADYYNNKYYCYTTLEGKVLQVYDTSDLEKQYRDGN